MFSGGDYIWQDWLPNSKYTESFPFMIQAYDYSRFHGLHDDKSELDWWVPVKDK
jgi:AraC family transcriptional regulator